VTLLLFAICVTTTIKKLYCIMYFWQLKYCSVTVLLLRFLMLLWGYL